MIKKEQNDIWDLFLTEWPIERVEKMGIDEYTKIGSDNTFTYWLESRLDVLGSIWGGSAFKFGVFNRKNTDGKENENGRSYSDEYGWYSKYGNTAIEAFKKVKNIIIEIIKSVQENNLKSIDNIDFGDAYKWKIASLYQNRVNPSIVFIFTKDVLLYNIENKTMKLFSELYNEIVTQNNSKFDIFDYSDKLWNNYAKHLRIWKVSHGYRDFSGEARNRYLIDKIITVHEGTKRGGGDNFTKKIKVGDYFYLCHGNDEGIVLFGKITTGISDLEDEEGWKVRKYEIIKKLELPQRYNGKKKGWTPNNNSTCSMVPPNELDLFNKVILRPYFNLDISSLTLNTNNINSSGKNKNQSTNGENKMSIISKNQILYGPPGTGKTFKLKEEFFNQFKISKKSISKEEFLYEMVKNLSWYEIFALVIKQSNNECTVPDIVKHELTQLKIKQLNRLNKINPTIWSVLQLHTIKDSKTVSQNIQRSGNLIFDKKENSMWVLTEFPVELDDIYKEINNFNPNQSTEERNYQFITFHQSYSYEEFVEGIKVSNDKNDSSKIIYNIEPGIFKTCCDEALKIAGYLGNISNFCELDKEERQKYFNDDTPKYCIFIDEINRGNISKIFGELITLIEEDKRLGENNELIVQLPYSKDYFGVPPNLYIIGTMNTADRSIEVLDTALRRRFSFKEFVPDYDLLNNIIIEKINIKDLLMSINKRIEVLFDRDHVIGHSYFLSLTKDSSLNKLKSIFKDRIIPLLQEYFYSDLKKLRLILGDSFITRTDNKDITFLCENDDNSFEDYKEKFLYNIETNIEKWTVDAFINIYNPVNK